MTRVVQLTGSTQVALDLAAHESDPYAHDIPGVLAVKRDIDTYVVKEPLGAAETFDLSNFATKVLSGTLSANLVITITPAPFKRGQRFRLELKQAATAKSVTITDGLTSVSVANIPSGAGAVFTVDGEVLSTDRVRVKVSTSAQDWAVTQPAVGFRTNRGSILPNSFVEIAIPATPTIDSGKTATIPAYLAQEALTYKTNINTTSYAPDPYFLPDATARVPVGLVNSLGEIVNATGLKGRVLAETGVPIPTGFQPLASSDAPATLFVPDFVHTNPYNAQTMTGMLWDLFRLQPAGTYWEKVAAAGTVHATTAIDPRTLGFAWECQNAMRLTDLSRSPGHPVDRFPTAVSSNPGEFLVAEAKFWGTTATALPLLPLMILREDVQTWVDSGETTVPAHALGVASIKHPYSPAPGYVWPAQNKDAFIGLDNTSPVIEGTRLWMPRSVGIPNTLHTVGKMIFRQAQEYGFVIWDHSANVTIRAEKTIVDFYSGISGTRLMDGFPWASLQVLAVGSDGNPNP